MIRELRRKFIRITMTTVFLVLFLILVAINCVNIYQNNRSLDSVTETILENGGTFKKILSNKNKLSQSTDNDNVIKDHFHNRAELPFSTRFFTIRLNENGEIVSFDLSSIASVAEEDVEEFANGIQAKNRTVGWFKNYRYRLGNSGDEVLIIVMEATSARSSVITVLLITLLVGLAAFLVVFLFVALFSGRAIKPISETYDKQRQFITDASHELKTPLTVISANAEVLTMTCGENEWSEGILRQAAHMRSLIGKMIRMSKLDEGEQTLAKEEFNLSDAVYDTAMSFRGLAESKELTLYTEVASDIRYLGDEGAIRQLVSILVDNAVKYCDPRGTILVRLARESRGLGRDKLTLSVLNSYASIHSLETDKLFERFYRADNAHTAGSSYGLGLPIAKSIVELHGGKISVSGKTAGYIEFCVVFHMQRLHNL